MRASPASRPALRGGLLAVLAAALFGISTPLVQRVGAGVGPFSTAALLYAGAAWLGALLRQPVEREARLRRADLPRAGRHGRLRRGPRTGGAGVGPAAHQRHQRFADAGAGSACSPPCWPTGFTAKPWTAGCGRRCAAAGRRRDPGPRPWRHRRRPAAGPAGGAGRHGGMGHRQHLVARRGRTRSGAGGAGQVARSARPRPCCWRWPGGEPLPHPMAALALLAIGATGYGLSLRLYLLAQRAFGAARTGSVFAFAPFIGAALAVALGDRRAGLGHGGRRRADACGRAAAPGRTPRARARARGAGARARAPARRRPPRPCPRRHARRHAQPSPSPRADGACASACAGCASPASALKPAGRIARNFAGRLAPTASSAAAA